jgi:hypothetical protein
MSPAAFQFLLDEEMNATSAWGSSLRMLVSLLIMVIAGIGLFIWWARRG